MGMSFEDYEAYYEKYGKTVDQISKPNNPLNDRMLKSKYSKYVGKEEKVRIREPRVGKRSKNDVEWQTVKEKVFKRDNHECQLLIKLPIEEQSTIFNNSSGLHNILDPAHTIWTTSGSNYKWTYLKEGIVSLNRYSHTCLDNHCDPITGKKIKVEIIEGWWEFILGKEWYSTLMFILETK